MTMTQLQPTLPLDTPKGPADCHFVIDYGSEANLLFVCFLRRDGSCWTFPGPEIRLEKNVTGGVRISEVGERIAADRVKYLEVLVRCLGHLADGGDVAFDRPHEDALAAAWDKVVDLRRLADNLVALTKPVPVPADLLAPPDPYTYPSGWKVGEEAEMKAGERHYNNAVSFPAGTIVIVIDPPNPEGWPDDAVYVRWLVDGQNRGDYAIDADKLAVYVPF